MNLYEFLANQFNNELGAKYLISYNNNLETDWDAILTDDLMLRSVALGGKASYLSLISMSSLVKCQNIQARK